MELTKDHTSLALVTCVFSVGAFVFLSHKTRVHFRNVNVLLLITGRLLQLLQCTFIEALGTVHTLESASSSLSLFLSLGQLIMK